ncbi:hypothetical protein DMA11_01460 [Marinilabiliaceae bacterium JC017]|nr:hypothetical protein DMA11_01460 [Marinilabiliaceae bacterium JC017]
MKYYIFLLPLFLLSVFGCGPSEEQLAKETFERANKLFNEKQFNDAKLILDSIIDLYPSQIEYKTRSQDLLRTIKISEQEENIIFLDSLLKEKEAELKPLMKNFIVSSEYGSKKKLIHKRQKPENSYHRVYLRVHLDLDGNFYISSRFTGTKRIHHNQIKVYVGSKHALSEKVPEDGFNNRSFDDGENQWEVVKYKEGKDNGVIDFISDNWNKSLKVQFIGKKYYYIIMEKFDKEAIRDANEISYILKEKKKIKEQIKNVKAELGRLKPNK